MECSLRQLRIVVSSGGRLNTDSGSVMHGVLMDLLPEPWPGRLHETGLKPFSQWIEGQEDGNAVWHIGIMDRELSDILQEKLRQDAVIFIRHLNDGVRLLKAESRDVTLEDYLTSFVMAEKAPPGLRLFFRTPAAHRSHGENLILPTVSLIAGSLQKRFEQMDPECLLADVEAVQQIADNTKLIRYRLESRPYNLEGTKVFGYTGFLDLRFQGEPMLRRLSAALFSMAEWSGVGIKTALGMGGCRVVLTEGD